SAAQLIQGDAASVPEALPPSAPGTPPPLPVGSAWWPGGAQPVTAMPIVSGFVIAADPAPTQVPRKNAAAVATTPALPLPALTTGTEIALRVTAITLPTPGAA